MRGKALDQGINGSLRERFRRGALAQAAAVSESSAIQAADSRFMGLPPVGLYRISYA